MKQFSMNIPIKDLFKLYSNDDIYFLFNGYDDSKVGRKNIWTNNDKSMYIYSILKGYLTYPFSFVEKNNEEKKSYKIIDGKQRIWAICDFIQNNYLLNGDIPDIDGIKLKNMIFCNLPIEVQHKLLSYNLTIYVEPEDVNENLESYICYNGGIALKPIELFKARLGKNIEILEKIVNHNVFSIFNIPGKNHIQDYELALYILMLETNPSIGLAKKDKESFVCKLSTLKALDDIVITNTFKNLDYFYSAFYNPKYLSILRDTDKYLKKSHIIILYQLIDLATKKCIAPCDFFNWSYDFFITNKDVDNTYWVESSRGSTTSKSSMDIRYKELHKHFQNYFAGLTILPFKLKA